ncbi:MAG: hypothetical protein JWP11_2619 [Frankiales bacterium]|nr:hypothetical protein [Frankiales bacterium]
MLDTDFDADQEALRLVARDFLAATVPLGSLRGPDYPHDVQPTFASETWRAVADLGWLGLGIPVEYGGGGAGLTTLCALYGELGRALVSAPCLEVAVVAGGVIASAGTEQQKTELLPELCAGRLVVIPTLVGENGEIDVRETVTSAERTDEGWRLTGTKPLVAYAGSADLFLVPAHAGGDAAGDVSMFLVPAAAPGVVVTSLPSMSGVPLSAVELSGVTVGADAVLGMPGRGMDHLAPAMLRGKVLRCAEIAGAGERVLDITVAYAKQREQFGKPIGQYQAVQYLCTDLAMATRVTQLLARQASWILDEQAPHENRVRAALAYGSDAARQIAHCSHEVLAGLGFMVEHDLHLFTRRLKHWEMDLGDAGHHSRLLADLLGASAAS